MTSTVRHLIIALLAVSLPAVAGCKKDKKKDSAAEPAATDTPATTADTPPATADTPPATADTPPATADTPPAAAGPTVGACTVKADKNCSETKLNNPGDSETYGKQCAEISKGEWAEGPCPMDNVVGECNSASAGRTVFYKGAKDPKHYCEQMIMGGTYTAAAK